LGRVPAFDLVIADEAHRCAGPVSSDFGTILDVAAIKAARRLFMTATPRYFTGRVVREAKEADFEVAGFVPNVVFPTGVVQDRDTLLVYYGAADAATAVAEFSLGELLASLTAQG